MRPARDINSLLEALLDAEMLIDGVLAVLYSTGEGMMRETADRSEM